MAFRAERHRLRNYLESDEEIYGSDFISVAVFGPDGSLDQDIARLPGGVIGKMVLVVTDRTIYVVFPAGMISAPLDRLVRVGRKIREMRLNPAQVQVGFPDGSYWNLTYDVRSSRQVTADLITECFFGRIVADTFDDGPEPSGDLEHFGTLQRSPEVQPGLFYAIGESVEITEGPYRDFQGDIRGISDSGRRVNVRLNVAEQVTRTVEFELDEIQHISTAEEESSFPTGIGWVEYFSQDKLKIPFAVDEGRFALDLRGITMFPHTDDSQDGGPTHYSWSSIEKLFVTSTTQDDEPMKLHAGFLDDAAVDVPKQMIVAHLFTEFPNDRLLSIIPTDPFTIEAWFEWIGEVVGFTMDGS